MYDTVQHKSSLNRGAGRLPQKDFALAWDRSIAAVAAITAVGRLGNGKTYLAEASGIRTQKDWIICTRISKSRQERNWFEANDGAADHPGAGAELGPAHQEKRAAFHLQAGEIAHRAFDGDDAARFMRMPTSMPADPSTRIAPPFIPDRLPR